MKNEKPEIQIENLIHGYHHGNKIYMSKNSIGNADDEFLLELSGGDIPTIRGGMQLGLYGFSVDMKNNTFVVVIFARGGKMLDEPLVYRPTHAEVGTFRKYGIGVQKENA